MVRYIERMLMETKPQLDPGGAAAEPAYVAPTLTFVGHVTEVVRSGGGKLSVDAPDGPDTRKPKGQ